LLDVRDRKAIDAFVGTLHGLDVLINAAGVARPEEEYEEAAFLDVMDVNLNSVMRLSMAARPLLARSKGSIVNFASMLSYVVDDAVPACSASKTGLLGLTRTLAHRFGPEGIRVNAIAPGYHKTAMTKGLWTDPEPAEDRGESCAEALGNRRGPCRNGCLSVLARRALRDRDDTAGRRRLCRQRLLTR
jgi:NAD(P)-dependent dehydrogenase (short-subunit alcohol dehydrogenase family)